MEKSKMIWIATWAFAKKATFEQLQYCDYMNGHEDLTDEVWEFVTELEEIGRIAFYEKYKEYKLY